VCQRLVGQPGKANRVEKSFGHGGYVSKPLENLGKNNDNNSPPSPIC
jgi:hypothetical protein